MAIRVRSFSPTQEQALDWSLALIKHRLRKPPGPIPRDLHSMLQDILSGRRPIVDLVFGGSEGICRVPYSRSAGYRILLCAKVFQSFMGRASLGRLPAVLFHELIHVARGWELDAEAFENAWFTPGEGARAPTREDWAIFREDGYEGWWVRVDPRTRRVTDYADRLIVTFPARPRGAKG